MGTCVSKCYPTSTAGSSSSPAAPPLPPAATCNAVAVHPIPLPLPSPSTSSHSQSTYSLSSSSSFQVMATSSSSSTSSFKPRERHSLSEWDVVVLDPNNRKQKLPNHHPDRRSPATSKRARPVSPLAIRPAPLSHHKKKKTTTVVRSTEPHADAQAMRKKKQVLARAREQRRLHHRVLSPAPSQVRRGSRGAPEDELTNPLISMDCFIFL